VGHEARERISLDFTFFTHQSRADHHAEYVESDLRAVAIQVCDELRLEQAIVVLGQDYILYRINYLLNQQIVSVVESGHVSEGVCKSYGQVEMVWRIGRVNRASRGNPPIRVALA